MQLQLQTRPELAAAQQRAGRRGHLPGAEHVAKAQHKNASCADEERVDQREGPRDPSDSVQRLIISDGTLLRLELE